MTDHEKAAMDAGTKFGMDMLNQIPRGDKAAMEAHMTGVLIVFWAHCGARSGPSTRVASSRLNCAAWNRTCLMSGSLSRGCSKVPNNTLSGSDAAGGRSA